MADPRLHSDSMASMVEKAKYGTNLPRPQAHRPQVRPSDTDATAPSVVPSLQPTKGEAVVAKLEQWHIVSPWRASSRWPDQQQKGRQKGAVGG